jgi:hypothetical protein
LELNSLGIGDLLVKEQSCVRTQPIWERPFKQLQNVKVKTHYLLPLSAIICKLRNILPVLENPQTHYRVLLSRNLRDATHYP